LGSNIFNIGNISIFVYLLVDYTFNMKKLITILLFIPFICQAQTKVQLQDSVTKYQDISNFIYDEYWGSSFADMKAGPYNEKVKLYQSKLDKITSREQSVLDSIQFSDRRKYLETKYKIKLP